MTERYNFDKIFFVPVGDYYEKSDLVDANHRYNMLMLSVEENEKMEVEDIAIKSKIKLYAVDTFKLIKDKYNKDEIYFIMGSDNFRQMPTWKYYEKLIENYNIIVIERERKKIRYEKLKNIIEFIPEKLAEIDSTQIRNKIKNNEKDAKKYLNPKVHKYIKTNKLYLC